jgi:aspartate kinase
VARLVVEGPPSLVVVVSALAGVTDLLAELCGGEDSGDAEADEAGAGGEDGRHAAGDAAPSVRTPVTPRGGSAGGTAGPAHPPRPEDVARIAELLRSRHVAVVDALAPADADAVRSDLDDRLAGLTAAALDEGSLPPRARDDAVLSAGEDLSALLVACAVRAAGREARVVDARTLVVTDDRHGRAVPSRDATGRSCRECLSPMLDLGAVAVVQGFVGATPEGVTTTLGRGGSDFTAAILGGALGAETVHIWTDVEGIMSGDPAAVDAPHLLEEVGFEEAVELAWAGARVIHPVAAKWAVAEGVPLRIRDTLQPRRAGTLVRHDVRDVAGIAAVSQKDRVALIKVRSHPVALPYGFLGRVFGVLGRHRLEVDLVATSHSSTAFTIDESEELEGVARELSAFADVDILRGLTTVTVVGRGLMEQPGLGARVFLTAAATPVHLISQASDVSLGFVVGAADAPELVRRLHRILIEAEDDASRRSA